MNSPHYVEARHSIGVGNGLDALELARFERLGIDSRR